MKQFPIFARTAALACLLSFCFCTCYAQKFNSLRDSLRSLRDSKADSALINEYIIKYALLMRDAQYPSISVNSNGDSHYVRVVALSRAGKKYDYVKMNDRVTQLFVDGVKISEKEIPGYSKNIAEIEKESAARNELRMHKATGVSS